MLKRQSNNKTIEKMNRQANASTKSKELQPNSQGRHSCSTFAFALTHADKTNRNILK